MAGNEKTRQPPRGRPRTITREALVAAGIKATLPAVTIAGISAELGVSSVALYKHVPSQRDLRLLVAEGILEQWQPPAPSTVDLVDYLTDIAISLRELVISHPGIADYLARLESGSRVSLMKFEATQRRLVELGLEPWQSSWMASTVAQYALGVTAVFDTETSREHRSGVLAELTDDFEVLPIKHAHAHALGDEAVFRWGVRGLIRGCLTQLADDDPRPVDL
ncbi:AcrR family transcriptional regulator [Rhodococcus sp. 27YEA15]|uniref:TetR/AcrR family transcriptional regulator C-terminal domain-containing protein n=1 Tax=Rhodococcus sp. 27YEA15 TaxID=3156259 RepID=UPI003C7E13C9